MRAYIYVFVRVFAWLLARVRVCLFICVFVYDCACFGCVCVIDRCVWLNACVFARLHACLFVC